ncbi:MAG TPA: hypothetical protein ENH82_00570 [bacterium]|nr:hypothetical protein [bacterium]
MKERPILFSGEMVRAILDRRKTQTCRVIKGIDGVWKSIEENHSEVEPNKAFIQNQYGDYSDMPCPYGKPGDRLWMRERFLLSTGEFAPTLEEEMSKKPIPMYYADDNPRYRDKDKWKPSIHMPRWASRILLEIVDIRVERLQDIGMKDIIAEGIDGEHRKGRMASIEQLRSRFRNLWDSINKKRGYGWAANPWVWKISFKVLDKK